MTVELQTFETLRDASSAVVRDPSARFLGGGTLLVRALNEDAADFSTLVRCADRALTEIRASGSRVRIGAAVTMAQVLASPDLAFLHPPARSVGGPAVRAQATVGGNLFAPPPYGDFAAALLALDARVSVQSGYSPRDIPIDAFLRDRDSQSQAVVAGVEFSRPRGERSFRFLKVSKVRPKGVSLLTIAGEAGGFGRPALRSTGRIRQHGADPDARRRGRTCAGRQAPGALDRGDRRRGRGGRLLASDRCNRVSVVSAGGPPRAPHSTASWRSVKGAA